MKKMSKMGKSILLSSLAIIAFGGIAAGTTYALFTSDATTSVSVTTGKVKVTQTVVVKEYYSPEAIDSDGTITDSNNAAKNNTFANGGSATLNDNGTVTITNMTPGDKITLTVTPTNESNVKIKYRETYSIEGDNTNELDVSSSDMVNLWTALDENGTIKPYDVTIELPASATGQDVKDVTIKLKVEAVQGNAEVAETVKSVAQLAKAVEDVNDGSTVEIATDDASPLNLTETLEIKKNLNFVMTSDVVAPAGQPAFNVTSGTVTLSAATVSDKKTISGRVRYAETIATESIPTIKSTDGITVKANGKDAKVVIDGVKIVNDGNIGVAAINDGEVVIESGEVDAREIAVLAEYAGKVTINGGTFTTKDNFVVGTNGTVGKDVTGKITDDHGHNTITINGGVFNGNISSDGYIACGVYVANSDTVNITGGKFNIENGCGILARSGNTTVSDKVAFNFTNTENGITEGWVGDTKIKLPVNAKIIKDLVAGYPGGTPTVDGKEVIELNQKDGKAYLVSDETSLRTAINDVNNATKYIYLKNGITLEQGRLDIITKYTTVYGSGKTELKVNSDSQKVKDSYNSTFNTYSQNRVFNLDDEDQKGGLKDGSFSLIGVLAQTSNTTGDGRVISSYQLDNFKFVLDNASLTAKYPLTIGDNSKSATLKVKDSSLAGYCAFQTYASKSTQATFENCVLTGKNPYEYNQDGWNDFGAIVVEKNVYNANFTFNNCTIKSDNSNNDETGQNKEDLLMVKNCSTGSATFANCKFYDNGKEIFDTSVDSKMDIYTDSPNFSYTIN